MERFIVEGKSVVARAHPAPTAPVVNAYKKGTKLNIVNLDSGWYMTESGSYIFKTTDLIPYSQWLKDHQKELDNQIDEGDIMPRSLRRALKKYGGAIEPNDVVRLGSSTIKDQNTGNLLPASLYTNNTSLTVVNVNGNNAVISDGSNQYTVALSLLEQVAPDVKEVESNSTAIDTANNIIRIATSSSGNSGAYGVFDLDIQTIRTVFGAPYQFSPITDLRFDGSFDDSSIGRLYGTKIAARAPILVMQAGVPEFLRGFDKDTESGILKTVEQVISKGSSELEQMIQNPGQYYGFKASTASYYGAVNAMCKAMAVYLGIDKYSWDIGEGDYLLGDEYSWENNAATHFSYHRGSVLFYVNAEPQINESLTNATSKSMLDQQMNQFGRMGSELQFLLGGAAGYTGVDLFSLDASKKEYSTTGGLIDSIIDNVQTVLAGGRMMFPEIWQDSTFMRSYSVNIKLVSPDADNLSIYLNILVPLAHILAFVFPRSLGNNNYISPFLVRAFYRSMFHIDMGIVTDCQIQRGDNMAWSQMGLPIQVNVQLSIKDLYGVMSMALAGEFGSNNITSNPYQLDYIANLCGINSDEPDLFGKTFEMWWAFHNPMSVIPEYLSLQSVNKLSGLYHTLAGSISRVFNTRY